MTKDKIFPEHVKKDLLKVAADEWKRRGESLSFFIESVEIG